MSPEIIVAVVTTTGAIVAAVIAYKRGAKGDDALKATEGMKLVVGGLGSLIDSLQEELKRQHEATEKCERECRELREDCNRMSEALDSTRIALKATQHVVEEQEGVIARLKMRISELETL